MYSPIACVGTLQVLLGYNCTRTYPQTQFCIPFECPPLPMAHPWSPVDAKCLGLSPVLCSLAAAVAWPLEART